MPSSSTMSSKERSPLELSEQITMRLSPLLVEGIDEFRRQLEQEEQCQVGRPEACRKLIARALRNRNGGE